METLLKTNFNLPGQTAVYHGKVRDVYTINDNLLAMVATDRISAFDVILPKGIPFKGQVINQIASYFLQSTADIVPNWRLADPDPMVTVGYRCQGFPVEMIIRGYLTGSAWREYAAGNRTESGVWISSMRITLPSRLPNSYLVSTRIRPFLAAISVPRAKRRRV